MRQLLTSIIFLICIFSSFSQTGYFKFAYNLPFDDINKTICSTEIPLLEKISSEGSLDSTLNFILDDAFRLEMFADNPEMLSTKQQFKFSTARPISIKSIECYGSWKPLYNEVNLKYLVINKNDVSAFCISIETLTEIFQKTQLIKIRAHLKSEFFKYLDNKDGISINRDNQLYSIKNHDRLYEYSTEFEHYIDSLFQKYYSNTAIDTLKLKPKTKVQFVFPPLNHNFFSSKFGSGKINITSSIKTNVFTQYSYPLDYNQIEDYAKSYFYDNLEIMTDSTFKYSIIDRTFRELKFSDVSTNFPFTWDVFISVFKEAISYNGLLTYYDPYLKFTNTKGHYAPKVGCDALNQNDFPLNSKPSENMKGFTACIAWTTSDQYYSIVSLSPQISSIGLAITDDCTYWVCSNSLKKSVRDSYSNGEYLIGYYFSLIENHSLKNISFYNTFDNTMIK